MCLYAAARLQPPDFEQALLALVLPAGYRGFSNVKVIHRLVGLSER
jgi:hypothetical protein